MKKIVVLICCCLLALPVSSRAQDVPEGWEFGGWEFFEVYHNFGNSPFFGSFYFEHDNFHYRYFDCWYTRTILGAKILPWLKADVGYDFMKEPSALKHKLILDVTGTLKSGNFNVSLRERYLHTWTHSGGPQANELRSRLKVQYDVPHTRWSPYLAVEFISWGQWNKTRHYVGSLYNFNSWLQLETYYIYYTHNGKPAQHILGIGLNFTL